MTALPPFYPPTPSPLKVKLLGQVRQSIRFKYYSLRTEQVYLDWMKRFIFFHGKRHPVEMGADEVREFLTHLTIRGRVAASTQNQAFSVLLFLYREVLKQELPWIDNIERAKRPVIFTTQEVQMILSRLNGPARLMANLLYGCGLRLNDT